MQFSITLLMPQTQSDTKEINNLSLCLCIWERILEGFVAIAIEWNAYAYHDIQAKAI